MAGINSASLESLRAALSNASIDTNGMTKAQMRQYCLEHNITIGENLNGSTNPMLNFIFDESVSSSTQETPAPVENSQPEVNNKVKTAEENYKNAKQEAQIKFKEKAKAQKAYEAKLAECKKAQQTIQDLKKHKPENMTVEEYKKAYNKAIRDHKRLSGELKRYAYEYNLANRNLIKSIEIRDCAAAKANKLAAEGSKLAKETGRVRENAPASKKCAKKQIRSVRKASFKNRLNRLGNITNKLLPNTGLGWGIAIGAAVLIGIMGYIALRDDETETDNNIQTESVSQENETLVETQDDVQQNAEQPDSADNANAVTEEPAAATSEETATTGMSDNGDAEIAEAEKIEKEVDEQVKKYSYSPGEAYKVEKGDCLWNIVKGLLTDKLGRTPTDAEIQQGVRKWVESDDDLSYTDDTHTKVSILPGQEIHQIEFDAVA